MEELEQRRKFYKRPGIRILSAVLVLVLVFSLISAALVEVKIQRDGEAEAATNYLAENTDYVSEDTAARFLEQFRLLQSLETVEHYYRLASTQIAREQYDKALANIDKALALYDSEEEDEFYQGMMMKRACLLVLLERYDEAETVLDAVLEVNPGLSDAYLVRAQIAASEGSSESLIPALIDYLSVSPADSEIRTLLAQLYFEQTDYESAIAELETVLTEAASGDDVSEAAYLCGLACVQISDYEAAIQHLSHARLLDDTLDGISYYIGISELALEDYTAAEADLTAAIESGDMVHQSLYSRGVCRLLSGTTTVEAALQDIQQAIDYAEADRDESTAASAAELMEALTTTDNYVVSAGTASTEPAAK